MSELFPPVTRGTGLGLSYNIGVTVFGGMSPVTMAWMGSFAFSAISRPDITSRFAASSALRVGHDPADVGG
jgi:MHS family proline/betaine transporter-like MFS transporter